MQDIMPQTARAVHPEPTLLFGLGATKAGTSWLYDYLRGHPECHLRGIKELHFFDKQTDKERGNHAKRLMARAARVRKGVDDKETPKALQDLARASDLEAYSAVIRTGDTAGYASFMAEGRTDERLIADITPSYALLSEGRLSAMAQMASDVRFIYLMRDPVSRLWSHVRMLAARQSVTSLGVGRKANDVFDAALAGDQPGMIQRSDYAANLSRMTAAIPQDKLKVMFYEELFSDDSLNELCDFLGLSHQRGSYGKKVLEGAKVAMTDAQRSRAVRLLAPQYDYVEAFMGRLPDAWQANRGEV